MQNTIRNIFLFIWCHLITVTAKKGRGELENINREVPELSERVVHNEHLYELVSESHLVSKQYLPIVKDRKTSQLLFIISTYKYRKTICTWIMGVLNK